jgi:uncharacterized protein DUF6600
MRFIKVAGIAGLVFTGSAWAQGTPPGGWVPERTAARPRVQVVTPPPVRAPGPKTDYYVPPPSEGRRGVVQRPNRFAYWLAPYGTWQRDERFGQVFVPSEPYVPYTKGTFAATADGQVAFVEDPADPIGWAVEHYGRWIWNGRWAWVPGDQWAPAWVVWSEDPTGQYVGWAPMPPEGLEASGWQFAPRNALFSEDVHRILLPRDRIEGTYRRARRVDRPDVTRLGDRDRAVAQLNVQLLKTRAEERMNLEQQLHRQFQSEREDLQRQLDRGHASPEERERQMQELFRAEHRVALQDEEHLTEQQRDRDKRDWEDLRQQLKRR